MKTDYDVLNSENLTQLIAKVKEYLAQGWFCRGGIAVIYMPATAVTGDYVCFYQAMEKRQMI